MEDLLQEQSTETGSELADRLIIESLAKVDGLALGISLGVLFGSGIFLATNILVLKGGDVIGPNLALLSQYFIGFEVSFKGSFIGLVYGLFFGFFLGWLIAMLRNFAVNVYVHILRLRGSISTFNDYIDHP